jgi:hypothetical protein
MEASLMGLGIKVTPGWLGGWVLDLEPVIGPEIAEAEEMTSQGIGQIRPKRLNSINPLKPEYLSACSNALFAKGPLKALAQTSDNPQPVPVERELDNDST